MPNSADKPIEVEPALDEDSDVIELTEEVPEEEGGFDLFDDFAMPEFRMPGESPATASAPAAGADAQPGAQAGDPSAPANDAANKDNVPGAAILGRRPPRARQETPMMETVKLGLHDIDKAIAEQREEHRGTDERLGEALGRSPGEVERGQDPGRHDHDDERHRPGRDAPGQHPQLGHLSHAPPPAHRSGV